MPERAGRRFSSCAKRERACDLGWTSEHVEVFWPVVQQGYEEHGRGAIIVDTTQRPTGEGHPLGYLP